MLAFSNPDVIRILRQDYIPVAVDDWYYRRKTDAEGEFFWKVSGQWGQVGDGSTRQQLTCVAAGGHVLSKKNEGSFPDQVAARLAQSLASFKNLPENERKPKVPELEERDAAYVPPRPPPGGVIVKCYTRSLERDGAGKLKHATLDEEIKQRVQLDEIATLAYYKTKEKPQPDRLWLTKSDIDAILGGDLEPGASFPVPEEVRRRIARYHLYDNTWGLPIGWSAEDTRSCEMTLHVEAASSDQVRLRLEGKALIATDADVSKAARGFDAKLLGFLVWDKKSMRFTRFDVVAFGEHWDTDGSGAGRIGRHPLGIAFEVANGDSPEDRVPPENTRGGRLSEYLGQ